MKKLIFTIIAIIAFFNHSVAQKSSSKSQIKTFMVKAMEWQEAQPIFSLAPTDWTNEAYYIGVSRAHKVTNDQKYLAALKKQGYSNNWQPFEITYHADDIAISYSYLYL